MQVTVGTALEPFQDPRNPKLVLPPADSVPFHDMFVAVTLEPLVVTFALQYWLRVWPSGNVQVTRQPLIAELPAVTLTSPWKPPGHCPATV